MELRYSFDPERFYLGTLCSKGHRWPGTDQSLRRITYRGKRGGVSGCCVGCYGRKQSSWLISFIDAGAMGLQNGQVLGKLCKAGHRWQGHEVTLKDRYGQCIECKKQRLRRWYRTRYQQIMADPALAVALKERERICNAKPERRQKRIEWKRMRRKAFQAQGLNADGTHRRVGPTTEERQFQAALRRTRQLPSVARLVYQAQLDYWKDNPDAKRAYLRECKRLNHRWRYMTEHNYRLYHRQKSKRRKALERGSIGVHVSPKNIRARYAQFNHCCAYCGAAGDMHMDHFVPIAKGGTHVLGNLVPACERCNLSKTKHDAETWYRSQPWFSDAKWRKILRVLGLGQG